MTSREIKRLLKSLQKPSEFEQKSYTVSFRTYLSTIVLGAIGILIAIFYGTISKSLSEEQVRLSHKQDTSTQMIEAQSKIIESLQKEFKLSQDVKNANDNANKMRFIAAIFKLGAKIGDSARAMSTMMSEGTTHYIDDILPILEGQLSNPYLCQDTPMLKRWNNAYVHLTLVGNGEQLLLTEDGKQYYATEDGEPIITERVPSPIDVLLPLQSSAYFFSAWKSLNEAYLYCGKKLKKEIPKPIKQ